MSDRLEQVLAARLGELQGPAGEPDWADVRRKAQRLTTRRHGLRMGTGVAAALVAVLAATPAFGLRGQLVELFSGGEPAPAPVTWVSAPIDAGFFVYELPKEHWQAGHRPTALVLEDADGNELARDTQLVRSIAEVQQPGGLAGRGH